MSRPKGSPNKIKTEIKKTPQEIESFFFLDKKSPYVKRNYSYNYKDTPSLPFFKIVMTTFFIFLHSYIFLTCLFNFLENPSAFLKVFSTNIGFKASHL